MTGDYTQLDPAFLGELHEMEHDLGFPVSVNSGKRTPEHNADPKVGGVLDSAHIEDPCRAADIAVSGGWQRYEVVRWALEHHIKRIGVGKTFVHLDRSPTLPQSVLWEYTHG